jgi:hypothetical protein
MIRLLVFAALAMAVSTACVRIDMTEENASKLSQKCERLGGTPQVVRFDQGRLLGKIMTVKCDGLNK